jgi:hypothetical protein
MASSELLAAMDIGDGSGHEQQGQGNEDQVQHRFS